MKICQENLLRHIHVLTEQIGVRLAGSSGEKKAADYVAEQFESVGARVTVEQFPVRERAVESEKLEVQVGGRWESFGSSLFSNTPGTGAKAVEAPLVFFEAPAEQVGRDLSHLRGKAVVHLGCHIESRESYRSLIEAAPAFFLFVDVRYPGTVALADGMFPAYTDAIGAVPTVNVAFADAWRWKVEGATAARLTVEGGMRPATSQNVVGELPGADPDAPLLFIGGHHDTQADSVGADDNATGVAGALECARVLAKRDRKWTIRAISFGAEEQLSVGSAAYVRRHRDELAGRGRFMFNLDSYGSHLGWNELICNGPDSMQGWIRSHFPNDALHLLPQIVPYVDHFPFVVAGVPAVSLLRVNCVAGRFFHHRPDDDLRRVSTAVMASLLKGVVASVGELAEGGQMEFEAAIPGDLAATAEKCWRDLFGGW